MLSPWERQRNIDSICLDHGPCSQEESNTALVVILVENHYLYENVIMCETWNIKVMLFVKKRYTNWGKFVSAIVCLDTIA